MLLFIGGIKTNNNFLNPLYGYVNNLVISNNALDYDDFNTLKDNIKCLHSYNSLGYLESETDIYKNISKTYKYDFNGYRIRKEIYDEITCNTITHTYYYNNGKLVKEKNLS